MDLFVAIRGWLPQYVSETGIWFLSFHLEVPIFAILKTTWRFRNLLLSFTIELNPEHHIYVLVVLFFQTLHEEKLCQLQTETAMILLTSSLLWIPTALEWGDLFSSLMFSFDIAMLSFMLRRGLEANILPLIWLDVYFSFSSYSRAGEILLLLEIYLSVFSMRFPAGFKAYRGTLFSSRSRF